MKIDRKALVRRHNPIIRSFTRHSPLTVGNGEFAFTVDATGLQTFSELYADGGVPLGTMSNWGWHTNPNPEGYKLEDYPLTYFKTFTGRKIGYYYCPSGEGGPDLFWLRSNPHRLHLGMVKFRLYDASGKRLRNSQIKDIHQMLDMWSGVITSRFTVEGKECVVETCVHPELDMISVQVRSQLIQSGRLEIVFHFPYGTPGLLGFLKGKNEYTENIESADWNNADGHSTLLSLTGSHRADFARIMDDDEYHVAVEWNDGTMKADGEDKNLFVLTPTAAAEEAFEFRCRFSAGRSNTDLPSFGATRSACETFWEHFWTSGGVVELAESRDSRALELERRIVLSQYLTAIHSSGSLPPQESGLVHNSWSGKFHLEMHWWHCAHFPLWGRAEMLEKSFSWYRTILSGAKKRAKDWGFEGARWPKCTAADGEMAPCYCDPFLIWQQPHPIYFAEIIYRTRKNRATLDKYKEIVFESAAFMASFAEWDEEKERYVLGPRMALAQESYNDDQCMNPAFELSYWAYGLSTAQTWQERLGVPRNERWDHVISHLSELPVSDGLYVSTETDLDAYRRPEERGTDDFETNRGIIDHPTMLAPLGMLPGLKVDPDIMKRTFFKVIKIWKWNLTWGWDYPLVAMTAARLGEGKIAVDCLLKESANNRYLPAGYNYGGIVYLPGNGGLLTAVAMMAAGWDGAAEVHAPGFPQDGSWTVRFEGLEKMP